MSKLFLKLAAAITLLVILIEGALLILSLYNKNIELTNLRHKEYKLYQENKLISENYVKEELVKYRNNIILLTLLICALIVGGLLIIYQNLIGRYIQVITDLNKKSIEYHFRQIF